MQAFVTGATGLLGNNLVQALLAQGFSVKALVRSPQKSAQLLPQSDRLSLIQGDMENVAGFAEELRGVDVLFNTAAYFREAFSGMGDHWAMLEKINITETIRLFEMADQMGVQRIVHTSSSASIAKLAPGKLSTEADLEVPENASELYAKSKILGDRAIAQFCQTHRIPVITIHPGWMFGPWDAAPTAGGRFVLDFMQQKLPGIIMGTGVDVVDVRDVVQVMIQSATQCQTSDRFIATGHFTSLAELSAVLEQTTGVAAPKQKLPLPLVFTIAWLTERWAAIRKQPALLTVNGITSISQKKQVSSAKAQQTLGIRFRPLAQTMTDTAQWYRQHRPELL